MTGLPEAAGGLAHHYRAADFDTLVDSPIVAGNPAVYEFSVKGKPHFLVNVGEGGVWDGPRSAADAQRIVETQAAFWGQPAVRQVRLHQHDHRGHRRPGARQLDRADDQPLAHARRAAATWTGSRWSATSSSTPGTSSACGRWSWARSSTERENYTKTLWVAEGFTDYYADLLAVRAGVITPEECSRRAERDDREPADDARPARAVGGGGLV